MKRKIDNPLLENVIQGSVVADIYKAWRDAGLDEPVVDVIFGSDGTADLTVLTLPLVSSTNSLAISEKQPEKSPEMVGALLSCTISRATGSPW